MCARGGPKATPPPPRMRASRAQAAPLMAPEFGGCHVYVQEQKQTNRLGIRSPAHFTSQGSRRDTSRKGVLQMCVGVGASDKLQRGWLVWAPRGGASGGECVHPLRRPLGRLPPGGPCAFGKWFSVPSLYFGTLKSRVVLAWRPPEKVQRGTRDPVSAQTGWDAARPGTGTGGGAGSWWERLISPRRPRQKQQTNTAWQCVLPRPRLRFRPGFIEPGKLQQEQKRPLLLFRHG
jgi:hypothetical protein